MYELKDWAFEDFITILTTNNIKQFYFECKKKHIDTKSNKKLQTNSSRISKVAFFDIMQSIFGKEFKNRKESVAVESKFIIREKAFYVLCEMLFNRFKIIQCEVKLEKNQSNSRSNQTYTSSNDNNLFYINELSNDLNEIDTYEFACALCIFHKIEFKEKMHLIFDITDVDEDGYVNESEIKNMVFSINFIFCDEDCPFQSNSSIINQSLSTIKSQLLFNMIMKYPGELYKILSTEKYVDYDQFYSAISKIENFKYTILPDFINLKSCLEIRKTEPEYEIEKKNIQEFLSITNEVVNCVKRTNSEIIKTNKDIKRLFENKAENYKENLSKKKLNYVEVNKKNSVKNFSDALHNYKTSTNLPSIPNSKSKHPKEKSNHYNYYNINFNKILNLEAQPGKIKIKENITTNSTINQIGTSSYKLLMTNSEGSNNENKNTKSLEKRILPLLHKELLEKKNIFTSYNDIMNEVKTLSNKNKNANNEDTEEIFKYINQVNQVSNELKTKLKNTVITNMFGNFDYKKEDL